MLLWAILLAVMFIVSLGGLIYFSRRLSWRIKGLQRNANAITRSKHITRAKKDVFLKELYSILNKSILEGNSVIAYQSVDLLKLAMGEGFMRADESIRLMGVIVGAIKHKQPDIAGFTLDVFKPLVRRLEVREVSYSVQQMLIIGIVALRNKNNFLTAKVVDFLFYLIERNDVQKDKISLGSIIHALQVIGALGMRRRDTALFQEIVKQLNSWRVGHAQDIGKPLIGMLMAWLHRAIKNQDKLSFQLTVELTLSFIESGFFDETDLKDLIVEVGNLARSACLNPKNFAARELVHMLVVIAMKEKKQEIWSLVIAVCGKVGNLALVRHGVQTAFPTCYPLLEAGRKLLWAELKFISYTDEVRRYALWKIIKECIAMASLAAKQDMTATAGEIIADFYKCWGQLEPDSVQSKSAKRFCQLILFFWLKNKRHSSRYLPDDETLVKPILFSDIEKNHLGI